jgi:predicted O-methyltransferase YrrM
MKFYKNFVFFEDYSFNVVKDWTHPFDFVWIDGDHTYAAVKQDFEDWFPLLADNGYVAFHDSAPVTSVSTKHKGYEGPIRLVTELKELDGIQHVETCDSITLFKKLPKSNTP